MSKIVNTEVWELFTGKQVAISEREDFNRSDHDSNTTVDLRSSNRITWGEFKTFKDFVANVPKSSPYTDYLLQLLWIREFRFGMSSLEQGDLLLFVQNAFVLNDIEINVDTAYMEITILMEKGYIQGRDGDHWHPSMASGSGWTTVYPLTLKGKKCAEKRMNPTVSAVDAVPPTKPIPPWKLPKDEPVPTEPAINIANPSLTQTTDGEDIVELTVAVTTASISPPTDTEDAPPVMQAASGRGIPQLAVEAYQESIEWAEEPVEVNLNSIAPTALQDMVKSMPSVPTKEDIEEAVYSGSIRAWIDANHGDKRSRRWALWKKGYGPMDIARLENPEWVKQAEGGSELAKANLKSEADNIRKQVKSFDEQIKKSHARST